MTDKKFMMLCLLTIFLTIFINQNAVAGSDWQAKQKQMFAQIPVKVGDVINKSNWEKVKDLLPEAFLNAVKAGDWIL
jgi:hypothetical protein